MDSLEQAVEHGRQQQSEGLNAPNDADFNHPALKPIHDKMVSSHQRRMQQVANKERELDRQLQQVSAMQNLQQSQHSAGPQQASSAPTEEYEWLDSEVKPLLNDPNASALRALIRSFDKRVSSAQPTSQLSSLQQTVESLQQQLQQTQGALTQERYARQIPEFHKKWGGALDEDMQQEVLKYALQTGTDLERALYATRPDVALAQERERIRKEVREQFSAEYGAGLEGMEDIVASQPNPNSKPVDSGGKLVPFSQTAMDVLGKGGMIKAVRDGFSREETVTEG